MGRVVSVANSEKGLGSRMVFRLLLRWAHSGVLGGFVKGPWSNGPGLVALEVEDEVVRMLRLLLLFSIAQAVKDQGRSRIGAKGVDFFFSPGQGRGGL